MTMGTPVVEVRSAATQPVCCGYGDRVLVVALRQDGTVAYRVLGDPLDDSWHHMWSGGLRDGLGALVMADELLVCWHDIPSDRLMFGRWSPGLQVEVQGPTLVAAGGYQGSMVVRQNDLALHFAMAGQHYRVTSANRGQSWVGSPPTPDLIDSGNSNVTGVDVDTIAPASTSVLWTEADNPP
jgi:hypothetical protein